MEFAVPAVVSTRGCWTTAGRTVDTEVSRATASSWAATASLALLALGRFVTGLTAFAVLTDAAFAAEEVEDFFLTEGVTLVTDFGADLSFAEEAELTWVTLRVGSLELLSVAFFPPVVFAIAIAFRLLPGENKPLKTFYCNTSGSAHSCYNPSRRFMSARF
jgi:hypothetical protein